MNDTEAKKTVSLKKLSAYLILFVVLGSGILYTFYRVDKAQKVKQPVQIYQEFLEGERKVGSEDIFHGRMITKILCVMRKTSLCLMESHVRKRNGLPKQDNIFLQMRRGRNRSGTGQNGQFTVRVSGNGSLSPTA